MADGDETVEAVLAEYAAAGFDDPDPALAALKRAIFLEDALGMTLTDQDLATGLTDLSALPRPAR